MGLEANSQVKKTFIRLKDNKFYTSEDKDFTTPFSRLSGHLVGLRKRDLKTKDGQEFSMLAITLNDGETYEVSVPYREGYGLSFLSALENADLSKKLYLSPSQLPNVGKDGKTYHTDFLNIFQGDDKKQSHVKQYYSVNGEGDKKMPRVEWVQIGRSTKKVKNDEAQLDFIDNLVAKFNEKLGNPVVSQGKVVDATDTDDQEGDDLPF